MPGRIMGFHRVHPERLQGNLGFPLPFSRSGLVISDFHSVLFPETWSCVTGPSTRSGSFFPRPVSCPNQICAGFFETGTLSAFFASFFSPGFPLRFTWKMAGLGIAGFDFGLGLIIGEFLPYYW